MESKLGEQELEIFNRIKAEVDAAEPTNTADIGSELDYLTRRCESLAQWDIRTVFDDGEIKPEQAKFYRYYLALQNLQGWGGFVQRNGRAEDVIDPLYSYIFGSRLFGEQRNTTPENIALIFKYSKK